MSRARGSAPGGLLTALLLSVGLLSSGLLAGCTVQGSGVAAEGEVAAYRSELSASRQADVRAQGVALCQQAMSSMVVMVRGYNTFIDRLNTTHSYARVGDLDEKARASLIAGSEQIRAELRETTPADVADPVRVFLATTTRLEDSIRRELRAGLNTIATTWTDEKAQVLTACEEYVPMPPASSATPRRSSPPATG